MKKILLAATAATALASQAGATGALGWWSTSCLSMMQGGQGTDDSLVTLEDWMPGMTDVVLAMHEGICEGTITRTSANLSLGTMMCWSEGDEFGPYEIMINEQGHYVDFGVLNNDWFMPESIILNACF